MSSFKGKNTLKSIEATCILPMDRDVTLKRSRTTPELERILSSRFSPSDWTYMRRLVRDTEKDSRIQRKAMKLLLFMHHLTVQTELLRIENECLRQALRAEKKHNDNQDLELQRRQEYHRGAVFWSPRKVEEARAKEKIRADDGMEEKLSKARQKESRKATRLQRQVELEDKRAEDRLKVLQEREKAEKAAARTAEIEARNTKKALQLTQASKRKASRTASSSHKRQKRVGDAVGGVQVQGELSPPLPKLTSRGRHVRLPNKFR
jgi:hypothetical protein